jgi:hypothetical protein
MKSHARGKRAKGQEICTRSLPHQHVQHSVTVATSHNHGAGFQTAELRGVGRVTRKIVSFGGAR